MRIFRKVVFWLHLITGVLSGIVIFIMCVTGALLSFERNIIEFAERDARTVAVPDDPVRLSPQVILNGLREVRPEVKPSGMSIVNADDAAWTISLGREGQLFVDPYTGAITGEGNKIVREVMSELRSWHRYIGLGGGAREAGKAVTGAGNLLFLFLAISGFYIWFPRKLDWRRIRPLIWFRKGVRGKARNFNWHTTIGFWTSLVLIVLTLTATVISYQWASNLLYTITGNDLPVSSPSDTNQEKPPYEFPSNIAISWSEAEAAVPEWRSINLRLPVENNKAVFTIDEGIYWNIFGRSTLTVDAETGETIKWEPYGEQNGARQLRSWFRFTHTGETGGIAGQFIGFAACIGGAFLVWTGFALGLKRFGNWRNRRARAQL